MRRWLLFATALLIGTAGAGGNALAATTPSGSGSTPVAAKPSPRVVAGHESFSAGAKQILRLSPKSAQPLAKALPRATQSLATLPPTAQINVTYVGFSSQARTAFQAAVNIWQTQIHSTVPIDVVADWSNLTQLYGDPSILGAAGPTDFVKNFTNTPHQNVYYPIALANAIAGSDQLPATSCTADPSDPQASGAEITASFNSAQLAWYYGTDGHPGSQQVDLESVVLHELGHGLGFVGTNDVQGDPNTGVGTSGLSNDGQNLTIFDTFAADGSGLPLDATYTSGTLALGNALRGADGGVEWDGAGGDAAAGGHPQLYAPSAFQEGSSYSHLDESTYPPGNPNALMTPGLEYAEVEHAPGPIMLGMFKDMGWPQTGSGNYHVAAPLRLVSQRTVTNAAPLDVPITGVDGVPLGATAVAVSVAVQSPTKLGYWSALSGCAFTANRSDTQNFLAGQMRSFVSVLPVDSNGHIQVSLTASPASAISGVVTVDLVGWYSPAGGSYHHLATAQRAFSSAVSASHPVDFSVLGVAGVPKTGVTAVVVNAGVIGPSTHSALAIGPGGVTSQIPTTSYDKGETTSDMAIVPVGSGANAGKIRVRLGAGSAVVVLTAIGWYGPATAGGQAFHPADPVRLPVTPRGQDVTVGGLPPGVPVMLDVHLAHPTSAGWLGAAPGGSSALTLVQEYQTGVSTSGLTITTTNAAGQVHLRVSAGGAIYYLDFQGWFS